MGPVGFFQVQPSLAWTGGTIPKCYRKKEIRQDGDSGGMCLYVHGGTHQQMLISGLPECQDFC
jgi:hypothetical protein